MDKAIKTSIYENLHNCLHFEPARVFILTSKYESGSQIFHVCGRNLRAVALAPKKALEPMALFDHSKKGVVHYRVVSPNNQLDPKSEKCGVFLVHCATEK